MSKFLLNLLLQISKALVNSKIQFLIRKFFFLAFGPADLAAYSAFGPASPRWPPFSRRLKPTGWPKLLSRVSIAYLRKYVFPFDLRLPSLPPLPRLSVKRAPAVRSVPHLWPPELTRAATTFRPPCAAQLRASCAAEPLPPRLHFPPLIPILTPPPRLQWR
jgi:hypothetical protein